MGNLTVVFILCVFLPPLTTAMSSNTPIPSECRQVTASVNSTACPEWCSCKINGDVLLMKCVNNKLTHIPSPPKLNSSQTLTLLFLCNSLQNVTRETFRVLKSVNITYLSLLFNNISYLAPDSFNDLVHLRALDLSSNALIGEPGLSKVFQEIANTIPLQKINISSMEITDANLTARTFHGFGEKSDFEIVLMGNKLTVYPYAALQTVKRLTYVDLGENQINDFSPPDNYTQEHLQQINLDNNYFPVFPNLCKSNKSETFFPHLIKIKIRWNFMRYLDSDRYNCLKTLKDIRLNGNAMNVLESNQFAGLVSLENITLSYIDINVRKIEHAPFNNSKLKNIYFRKNGIWFKRRDKNLHLFEGCSSLELLNLCDNFMGNMKEHDFETLLAPVADSLKELILGGCSLTLIPVFITRNLSRLQNLVMYRNAISVIPDGTFDSMRFLDTVRFADNQLSIITEKTFPESFKRRAKAIELGYNPFSCICDLRWFINWIRSNPKIFARTLRELNEKYQCTSPEEHNGKPLLYVYMSENECLMGLPEKITTLTVGSIVILLLMTTLLMYRFRWQIRYMIYMMRYSQRQEVDTGQYEYDAFVAFSKADRPWVVDKMLPVLESEDRLKICVHDRDFLGGKLVIDNIVGGIEKSRRVIVVMSNSFAQSRWCQFEMNLVQHHALEHDQCLIVVVLLEEIDSCYMTKALKALLQTTTYLLWGEDEFAKKAFFNRLRMLLQKPRGNRRRLSV